MSLSDIIINEEFTVRKAMNKINKNGKRIVVISNKENTLKGVLTDGDLRRWLVNNGDLDISIKSIVNYSPIYITINEKDKAKEVMKKYSIDAVPVIDEEGKIESIIFWDDIEFESVHKNNKLSVPVVIMAGGLGTRLYPYTKILPKPLIPIGDIPIVERILNNFKIFGCEEYYLTVNYKKDMIKAYFSEKEYLINYVEENKPLGTGGSLALLKNKIKDTFFLSNCDILIDANYSDIYNYHKRNCNLITIVCAVKNMKIPYGIINLSDDGNVTNMLEKPEYSFLTNTGMYVVEKEVLKTINENEFIDFPEIIEKLMNQEKKVGVYSISEKCWMDMGQVDEMQDMIRKLEA